MGVHGQYHAKRKEGKEGTRETYVSLLERGRGAPLARGRPDRAHEALQGDDDRAFLQVQKLLPEGLVNWMDDKPSEYRKWGDEKRE